MYKSALCVLNGLNQCMAIKNEDPVGIGVLVDQPLIFLSNRTHQIANISILLQFCVAKTSH